MSKKKSTLAPPLFADDDDTVMSVFGESSTFNFVLGYRELITAFEHALALEKSPQRRFSHLTALENAVITLKKESTTTEPIGKSSSPPEQHAIEKAEEIINQIHALASSPSGEPELLLVFENLLRFSRTSWLATGSISGFGAFQHESTRHKHQRSAAGSRKNETNRMEKERSLKLYDRLKIEQPGFSISTRADQVKAMRKESNFSVNDHTLKTWLGKHDRQEPGRKPKKG